MTTLTLIILAYIANIFLNRWLNKIYYQTCDGEIIVWTWFWSILCTIILLLLLLRDYEIKNSTWFTGKDW